MANFFNTNIFDKINSKYSQAIGFGSSGMSAMQQALSKVTAYLKGKLPQENAFMDILSVSDDLFPYDKLNSPITFDDVVISNTEVAQKAWQDLMTLYDHAADENGFMTITLDDGDAVEFGRGTFGIVIQDLNGNEQNLIQNAYGDIILRLAIYTKKNKRLVSVWDLLSQMKQSFDINNILYTVCSQLKINAVTSITDIISVVEAKFSNISGPTQKVYNGIKVAYAQAGLYGVIQYIMSYFQAASSVQVGDDGLIEFADNASLIPSVYLVGVLSSVFSTLAQIAGAIVIAVSKVAGAVLFVLGGLISTVTGAASYDYQNSTKAKIFSDVNTQLAPIGISQVTRYISSETGIEAKKKLNDTIPFILNVPGGQVIVTSNGTRYRMEFHPDIIDRRTCLKDNVSGLGKVFLYSLGTASQSAYANTSSMTLSQYEEVMSLITNFSSEYEYTFDDKGLLSDSSDEAMREIIACNIILFMLHLQYVLHGNLSLFDVSYKNMAPENSQIYDLGYASSNFSCSLDEFKSFVKVLFCGMYTLSVSNLQGEHWAPSWSDITRVCAMIAQNDFVFGPNGAYTLRTLMGTLTQFYIAEYMTDDIFDVPYNLQYALVIPKYDRGSFWAATIAISVAAAVAIGVAVVATVSTLKAIRNKKMANAQNLESKWEAYKANPTAANMKAYQKAVGKNNLFNKFFGGTQYSKEGLWASSGSSSDSVTSKFSECLLPLSDAEEGTVTPNEKINQNVSLDQLYGVITGSFFTPESE